MPRWSHASFPVRPYFDPIPTSYHLHNPYSALRQTVGRDFERLCLWLVEREGYLRCRELTEEEITIVEGLNH